MDFKDQKERLIKSGHQFLGLVKKKNYGWDIIEDVMDEQHITELKEWFKQAEEFVEVYGLECHKERFNASSWIINQDERVNVERIKGIISIIGIINQE